MTITETIFTELVLSQQLLHRTPKPDLIKIRNTVSFPILGHKRMGAASTSCILFYFVKNAT